MKKVIKSFWMTYDLGVSGDYQGLFSFLDDYKAIECGPNTAYFKKEFTSEETDESRLDKLKTEIEKSVKIEPTNRIYIVSKGDKTSEGKVPVKGRFIIGKRKASPWEGYGSKPTNSIDGE